MKNFAFIAFTAMLITSPSFASGSVSQTSNAAPAAEIGLLQSVIDFLFSNEAGTQEGAAEDDWQKHNV